MTVKVVKQTLPTIRYEDGKPELHMSEMIACSPYGEMADGTMVWESENGEQFIRCKLFGKYFFSEF